MTGSIPAPRSGKNPEENILRCSDFVCQNALPQTITTAGVKAAVRQRKQQDRFHPDTACFTARSVQRVDNQRLYRHLETTFLPVLPSVAPAAATTDTARNGKFPASPADRDACAARVQAASYFGVSTI